MKPSINHVDMVAQLAKPGQAVIDGLTPLSAHLLHMAIGVSGEVGELIENFVDVDSDRENAVEELGDIEFYFQGLVPHIFEFATPGAELTCRDAHAHDCTLEILQLAKHSGALLDAIKKSAIYVKDLDVDESFQQLVNVRRTLSNIYHLWNITREEAVEANIAKLGKRYKGHNYSDAQAQDRADKLPEGVKKNTRSG